MIWGIAVHTSTLGISPVLRDVARASGYFRMEAFMAISGLLTGLLIERFGAVPTLRRRLVALLVPLGTGLLLLNPLANYLAYVFHNGAISLAAYFRGETVAAPQGPMVWHLHLWFLIALGVYAVVTPLLARSVRGHLEVYRPLIRQASPRSRFLLLCAGVPVACLAGRLVFEVLLERHLAESWLFLVRATFYYLPFFCLGLALYRSKLLLDAFARVRWSHLAAGVAFVMASRLVFTSIPKPLAETANLLSGAYLGVVLTATLFALARRLLAREVRWIGLLSDASYTIYLLHFLVIYAVALAARPWLGETPVLVVVVLVGTLAITFAVHHAVIRRIPLLRFLFNGRTKGRRTVPLPTGAGTTLPPSPRGDPAPASELRNTPPHGQPA